MNNGKGCGCWLWFQGRTYAEAESRWWRGRKQSPVSSCRGCSLDTGGGSPTTMGDQVPRWGRRGGDVKKSSLPLSSGAPSVLISPLQAQALPMEALQAQERKRRKNCAGWGMSLGCGRVGNCLVFYHPLSLGEPPGAPSLILCTWKPNALWRPHQLGWAQALPPTPIQGLFWRHGSWTKTSSPTYTLPPPKLCNHLSPYPPKAYVPLKPRFFPAFLCCSYCFVLLDLLVFYSWPVEFSFTLSFTTWSCFIYILNFSTVC